MVRNVHLEPPDQLHKQNVVSIVSPETSLASKNSTVVTTNDRSQLAFEPSGEWKHES